LKYIPRFIKKVLDKYRFYVVRSRYEKETTKLDSRTFRTGKKETRNNNCDARE
jgi:hypothetical protein